mmetsp:Transcript_12917/g.26375  ORF Transcript_12917/g.26375 Transcript_12917/m.26375 type:complete len:235 (+) Transcript_12917:1135-1839(+)
MADPPGLVIACILNDRENVVIILSRVADHLSNGNSTLDSELPHGVLLVLGQMLVDIDHVSRLVLLLDHHGKGGEGLGSRTTNHRSFVFGKGLVEASELVLSDSLRLLVDSPKDTAGRNPTGEPISGGHSLDHIKQGAGAFGIHATHDRVQGGNGCIADHSLLNACQLFQNINYRLSLVAADERRYHVTELLGHLQQHLVVVVGVGRKERKEAPYSLVWTKSLTNHLKHPHCIQP